MILTTHLLTLATLVLAGDAARFHPANADVYIEVPDVRAVTKAYADAPLVKTLHDPAIEKITAAAKLFGVDLKAAIAGSMPIPDPQRPDDPCWPWSALTSMSVSVAGLDSSAGAVGHASGWLVLDFADAESAAQALVAFGGTAGVTRVSTQGATKPDAEAASGAKAESVTVEGKDAPVVRHEIELLGQRVPLWLARADSRIVGGFAGAQPVELAARLAKPESGLGATHATLVKDEGLPAPSGVLLARAWSDLERLDLPGMSDAGAMTAKLADMVGAVFVPFVGQRGRYRMQLVGDRFVSESLTEHIGPARALDEFYGTQQVPATTARFVPKEAVGAWLLRFRPQQLDVALQSLLVETTASMAPDAPKPPSLSAGVGDSAAVFLMPLVIDLSGKPPVPNTTIALELLDAKAFQAALDAWIAHVTALDPKLRVQAKPYRKLPFYSFTHADGETADGPEAKNGIDDAVNPTIAILPDRILISISRKYAQSEVRRIEGAAGETHVIAGEGFVPKDAFEVGWMDWGTLVGRLYDLGRGFLPMIASKTSGFDANSLPTAAELFRHVQPSTSFTKRVDGKLYSFNSSSFGPETPLAMVALSVAIQNYGAKTASMLASSAAVLPGASETDGPIQVGHVVRETGDAGKDATKTQERAATMSALRDVKTGLAVYRSQLGRVPDTLDELLKGTDAFPKGFLDSGAVPKDGWNHVLVYSAQEKGARYTLRSCGPDGIDDKGSGDDVIAP